MPTATPAVPSRPAAVHPVQSRGEWAHLAPAPFGTHAHPGGPDTTRFSQPPRNQHQRHPHPFGAWHHRDPASPRTCPYPELDIALACTHPCSIQPWPHCCAPAPSRDQHPPRVCSYARLAPIQYLSLSRPGATPAQNPPSTLHPQGTQAPPRTLQDAAPYSYPESIPLPLGLCIPLPPRHSQLGHSSIQTL